MNKQITFRANELDLERLNELKEFYAECWLCRPEDITTTEVISAAIGMLHRVKIEWNLDIAQIATDAKNGELKY